MASSATGKNETDKDTKKENKGKEGEYKLATMTNSSTDKQIDTPQPSNQQRQHVHLGEGADLNELTEGNYKELIPLLGYIGIQRPKVMFILFYLFIYHLFLLFYVFCYVLYCVVFILVCH